MSLNLRKLHILQRLGLTWSELIAAALDAAEAAWDHATESIEPDSEGGKEVTQEEKRGIALAAGEAFGKRLAKEMGCEHT